MNKVNQIGNVLNNSSDVSSKLSDGNYGYSNKKSGLERCNTKH